VLVEFCLIHPNCNPVEVGEEIRHQLARLVLRLARLSQQIVDQRLRSYATRMGLCASFSTTPWYSAVGMFFCFASGWLRVATVWPGFGAAFFAMVVDYWTGGMCIEITGFLYTSAGRV
jgi:hypothetical protein